MRDIILYSLAIETTRICLTYPNFGEILNLSAIAEYEEKDKLDEALGHANFQDVIDKILSSLGKSVITSDIDQILAFLTNKQLDSESGEIMSDFVINNGHKDSKMFRTYDEVYRQMPPIFFDIDIIFTKEGNEKSEINLSEMSSGERQILFSNSAVLYHLYNIANSELDTRIIPYKNINIVLDEVELYYHPEYQRKYIASFIDMLTGLHIDKTRIRSINLIIATHSPFILSDVPRENVLCLEKGKCKPLGKESYCANIYDLMNNSFFLDYPMGEVAKRRLDAVIEEYNNCQKDEIVNSKMNANRSFYNYLIEIIADPYLKETISLMIAHIMEKSPSYKDALVIKKEELEKELNEINDKLNGIR